MGGRNGMRRMTTIIEETVQLPDYLLSDVSAIFPDIEKEMGDDNQTENSTSTKAKNPEKLISQVKTKFEHGFLVITVPNKPEEKVEDKKQKKNDGPVDIEIEFV